MTELGEVVGRLEDIEVLKVMLKNTWNTIGEDKVRYFNPEYVPYTGDSGCCCRKRYPILDSFFHSFVGKKGVLQTFFLYTNCKSWLYLHSKIIGRRPPPPVLPIQDRSNQSGCSVFNVNTLYAHLISTIKGQRFSRPAINNVHYVVVPPDRTNTQISVASFSCSPSSFSTPPPSACPLSF